MASATAELALRSILARSGPVGQIILGKSLSLGWADCAIAVFTESASADISFAFASGGVISREGTTTTRIEQGAGQTFAKLVGLLVMVDKVNSTSTGTCQISQASGNVVLDDSGSSINVKLGGCFAWISDVGVDCSPSEFGIQISTLTNGTLVHVVFIGTELAS
jgi:hypothetical protein